MKKDPEMEFPVDLSSLFRLGPKPKPPSDKHLPELKAVDFLDRIPPCRENRASQRNTPLPPWVLNPQARLHLANIEQHLDSHLHAPSLS